MSKRRWLGLVCSISLISEFFAAGLLAQTGAGQIQGTITDATGAVVPRAAVTLENVKTENRFQAVTSEVGAGSSFTVRLPRAS